MLPEKKFSLSQRFRPATPKKIRAAREPIARTDAKIARQLASPDFQNVNGQGLTLSIS